MVRVVFHSHLGGQMGKTMRTRYFLAKFVCYSPQFCRWAWGSSVLWVKNRPRYSREAVDHPSVVRLIFCGHLGGQTGVTVRMGHFQAKSECYSPWFWGWSWGPGVLWAKNLSGHSREVRDHPNMIHLIFHVHLGGQTGETV